MQSNLLKIILKAYEVYNFVDNKEAAMSTLIALKRFSKMDRKQRTIPQIADNLKALIPPVILNIYHKHSEDKNMVTEFLMNKYISKNSYYWDMFIAQGIFNIFANELKNCKDDADTILEICKHIENICENSAINRILFGHTENIFQHLAVVYRIYEKNFIRIYSQAMHSALGRVCHERTGNAKKWKNCLKETEMK